MYSDEILIYFKPIDLKGVFQYLEDFPYSDISIVARDFVKMSEDEIANYRFPDFVFSIREDILDSRYGKDSERYKRFNTIITAINLIKSCVQINQAIYKLQNKYKKQELLWGRELSSYSSPTVWFNSTDEDVLRIKNAAIDARDKINSFSKKYTVEGFEKGFIDKIKYNVYAINSTFMIDTRTIGKKAEDFSIEVFGRIILYGLLFLIFFLVAKCATG